jgi:hypothetical protein
MTSGVDTAPPNEYNCPLPRRRRPSSTFSAMAGTARQLFGAMTNLCV